MAVHQFSLAKKSAAQKSEEQRATGRIRRILVGLPSGDGAEPMVRYAISLARRHGAELTGLSIVDTASVNRREPVPAGAIWAARMAQENRLARAREHACTAVAQFEALVAGAGIRYGIVHEEQKAELVLDALGRSHDLTLLPSRQWFDHAGGSGAGGCDGVLRYAAHSPEPLIAMAGAPGEVRHLFFCCDGSGRSARTLKWLLHLNVWPDATIHLAAIGGRSRPFDREVEHCRAFDVPVEVEGAIDLAAGDRWDAPFSMRPDAIAIGNTGRTGLLPWLFPRPEARCVREADCPVVLG